MKNPRFLFRQGWMLLFCVVLGGCGGYHAHFNEMLNEYSCRRDATSKVGPDREAILFVKHHIMVSDSNPFTGSWDKHGFTRTPKEVISWESSRFALYRRNTIGRLMDGVNELLYAGGTHLFLVNDGIEINVDPDFFPADFDLQGNPRGHTLQVMRDIVANDPRHIHILYGWTSSSKAVVAGNRFAVVVADDPRYGTRITSKLLIRDILNALYPQEENTGKSLRFSSFESADLSREQIRSLWQSLNTQGTNLKSISCMPVDD